MVKRAHAKKECIGLDAKFLPTPFLEEQEAIEMGEVVAIFEANLTIEEVVGKEKYCFIESKRFSKEDIEELANDLSHVLFSEEYSLGDEATKNSAFDLLLDSDAPISSLYRSSLQAPRDYSGDGDIAYRARIRYV